MTHPSAVMKLTSHHAPAERNRPFPIYGCLIVRTTMQACGPRFTFVHFENFLSMLVAKVFNRFLCCYDCLGINPPPPGLNKLVK